MKIRLRSWRVFPGPQSTQRANFPSQLRRNSVLTQTRVFLQFKLFGCFEALSGLPEPDFNSASVGGTTFEGSDYICSCFILICICFVSSFVLHFIFVVCWFLTINKYKLSKIIVRRENPCKTFANSLKIK